MCSYQAKNRSRVILRLFFLGGHIFATVYTQNHFIWNILDYNRNRYRQNHIEKINSGISPRVCIPQCALWKPWNPWYYWVFRLFRFIPTPKYKTDFNCFCLGVLTWYTLIWYRLSQFYKVLLLLLSNSYHEGCYHANSLKQSCCLHYICIQEPCQ